MSAPTMVLVAAEELVRLDDGSPTCGAGAPGTGLRCWRAHFHDGACVSADGEVW